MARIQRFSSLEYNESQIELTNDAHSMVLHVKHPPAALTIITDRGEQIVERIEKNCILGESWIMLPSHE